MIKADVVEGVEQCEATLDFVHLDHALEHVLDGDVLALVGQVVHDSEDDSEIVGQVPPWNNNDDSVVTSRSQARGDIKEREGLG